MGRVSGSGASDVERWAVTGIDVLGIAAVRRGGASEIVRRGNDATVLTLLVLATGRPLPISVLVDELYVGREPPDTARTVVHGIVSRLRRAGLVITAHGSADTAYSLDLTSSEPDLKRFEDLVAQCRSAAGSDPIRALAVTDELRRVVPDRPFPAALDTPRIERARDRVRRDHAEAVLVRLRVLAQLGRHDEVVRDAEAVMAASPHQGDVALLLAEAHAVRSEMERVGVVYDRYRHALAERGLVVPDEYRERFDALWARSRAATASPQRRTTTPSLAPVANGGFIGRERELSTILDEAGRVVSQGVGSALTLIGPPGVGKSTLLAEVAEQLRRRGWTVLVAEATNSAGVSLSSTAVMLAEATRLATAAGLAGASAMGDLLRAPRASVGEPLSARRTLLLHHAADLIGELATTRPLVLLADRLAELDDVSVALLRSITAEADRNPTLIISALTIDEEFGAPTPAVLGTPLALHPFTLAESAELLRRQAPMTLQLLRDELVSHCHELSAGSPLQLTELARTIRSSPQRLTLDQLRRLVPVSLADVVSQRLDGLSFEARRALTAGLVCGDRFDAASVRDVLAAESIDRMVEHLDDAVVSGLLLERPEPDAYEVRHGSLRQIVLAQAGQHLLRRFHGRRAELLDRTNAPAAAVVEHRLQAELGDAWSPALVSAVHHAVRELVDDLAFERAVALARRGLAGLAPDDGRRGDLEIALATALSWLGERVEADALLASVRSSGRASGDAGRVAAALLAVPDNHRVVFDDSSVYDDMEWVWARPGVSGVSEDDRIRIGAKLLSAAAMPGLVRVVPVLLSELVEAMPRVSPRTRAQILSTRSVLASPGPGFDREAVVDMLRLADEHGMVDVALAAHSRDLGDLTRAGDFDEAASVVQTMHELAIRYHWPRYEWISLAVRSTLERTVGDATEAERLALDALRVGQAFQPVDAQAVYGMHLYQQSRQQGRLGDLVELIRPGARRPGAVQARLFLVDALIARGDTDEAAALLDEMADVLRTPPADEFRVVTIGLGLECVRRAPPSSVALVTALEAEAGRYAGQWMAVGLPAAILGPVPSVPATA